jgi:hypothetical protein
VDAGECAGRWRCAPAPAMCWPSSRPHVGWTCAWSVRRLGDSHVRLATEEDLSRDVEGYELGALLSLGALAGDNVYRSRGAATRQWWLRPAGRR